MAVVILGSTGAFRFDRFSKNRNLGISPRLFVSMLQMRIYDLISIALEHLT